MVEYVFDNPKLFVDCVRKASLLLSSSATESYRRLLHVYDDGTQVWVDAEGDTGTAHMPIPATINQTGGFTVIGKEFEKTARALTDTWATTLTESDGTITVKQGRRKLAFPSQEYGSHAALPEPVTDKPDETTTLETTRLWAAVNEVAVARHTDRSAQGMLATGVFIYTTQEGEAYAYAVSRGLAHAPGGTTRGTPILFAADYNSLTNATKIVDGTVEVWTENAGRKLCIAQPDGAVFSFHGINATKEAINQFSLVNIKKILADDFEETSMRIQVNKRRFVSLAKSAVNLSDSSKTVFIHIGGEVTVSSKNNGREAFSDTMPCDVVVDNTDGEGVAFTVDQKSLGLFSGFTPPEDGNLELSVSPTAKKRFAIVLGDMDSPHYFVVSAGRV